MERRAEKEVIIFEVSVDRVVGMSQEIRVGRAFQEEGIMLLGQSQSDGTR